MRPLRWFLTGALVLGGARSAQAADTVTKPAPGVTYLLRTTATPNRIHAVTVDLCAPGIRIRATAPDEKGKTVSAFAKSVEATAAINGGFFELGTFKPSGLAIGDGQRWTGSKDDSYASFIAFGANMADLPDQTTSVGNPPAWMTEAVAGVQQVVKDGKALTEFNCSHSGAPCTKAPRTSVGMSKDRQKLFMVVVDGRSETSGGMTVKDLGPLMAGLGAYDAINLDGGGSSEMWLGGAVKNKPSDGAERVVSNHLAVIADGTGPAAHCNAMKPAVEPGAPAADVDAAPAEPNEETEEGPATSDAPATKPSSPRETPAAAPTATEADAEAGCSVTSRSTSPPVVFGLVLGAAAMLFQRRRRATRSS